MSWVNELVDLYEKNDDKIGVIEYRRDMPYVLLPPFHTTVTAQIVVTIVQCGIFMNAEEHVPSETVSPENAKGRFSPSPAWFQEYGTFSAKDVQIWELPFDCHFRLFRYSC